MKILGRDQGVRLAHSIARVPILYILCVHAPWHKILPHLIVLIWFRWLTPHPLTIPCSVPKCWDKYSLSRNSCSILAVLAEQVISSSATFFFWSQIFLPRLQDEGPWEPSFYLLVVHQKRAGPVNVSSCLRPLLFFLKLLSYLDIN